MFHLVDKTLRMWPRQNQLQGSADNIAQHSHARANPRKAQTFYQQPDVELVMDVLRYGADVEVLEPASLREQVRSALTEAAARYA